MDNQKGSGGYEQETQSLLFPLLFSPELNAAVTMEMIAVGLLASRPLSGWINFLSIDCVLTLIINNLTATNRGQSEDGFD